MGASSESQAPNSDDELNSEFGMIPSSQEHFPRSICSKTTSSFISYNKTTSSMILKGVFGKVPEREPLVKLLVSKFLVQARNLSAVNYVGVMEIMARKLVSSNYIKLKAGSGDSIKNSDLTVVKEIDISLVR